MKKLNLKDKVVVIAGKEKGKTGELKSIDLKNNRVTVSGINIVKKALKPNQQNPAGGIIEKESPIHISNVALWSEKKKKGSAVKIVEKNGKKQRVLKKCGTVL